MKEKGDPIYPLEQVLGVKEKRADEAQRLVVEKKKILEREEEKLKRVQAERDEVKRHYKDKLEQLRGALDEGETTDKIQMMRQYLQVVEEKLALHEDKVKKQKLEVDQAKKALEEAKEQWRRRMREVDKIKEHRKQWLAEAKKELEREEAKEQDELGSVMFMSYKRKYEQGE